MTFYSKVAVITGAYGGLGKSLARQYLDNGYDLCLIGRNRDKLIELSKSLRERAPSSMIRTYDCDFGDKYWIKNVCKKISTDVKKVDVLINAAAVFPVSSMEDMHLADFETCMQVNVIAPFVIMQQLLDSLKKSDNGKIINITSVVGHTGNIGQANYTASKAAIVAMSKSLAIEYAKKNININCISPGFIKTAMTDKIDEKFKEVIISKIPSARLGEPDDIANAVLFLTSDQSSYINGETIHVNGGMYMA